MRKPPAAAGGFVHKEALRLGEKTSLQLRFHHLDQPGLGEEGQQKYNRSWIMAEEEGNSSRSHPPENPWNASMPYFPKYRFSSPAKALPGECFSSRPGTGSDACSTIASESAPGFGAPQ